MSQLLSYYRIVNTLSIDVAVGAVVSAIFFAKIFDVEIRPYGLAALWLTVWIIYTADHLRDARSIAVTASSERHAFHQRHFKILLIVLSLAVLIDAGMIFFIRRPVLIGGIVLSAMTGLYLITQGKMYFLKEVMVAVLYTSGVILPSVAVTKVPISTFHVGLICQFTAIALLNLLIFSWFDRHRDKQDSLRSFVTRFGEKFTQGLIWIFSVLLLVLSLVQLMTCYACLTAWTPVVMTLVLMLIFIKRDFFSNHDYYRLLGDAVFFIPALIFI
jgi:hypothetical protein